MLSTKLTRLMIIKFKVNHINSLQIFQLLRYVANILISVFFAKSYLSTKEIGIYESFIFYFSIFTFFWLNGLIQSILTLSKKAESKKKLIVLTFNNLIIVLIFSVLSSLFVLLFLPEQFFNKTSELNLLFALYLFLTPSTWLIEYIILLNKKYRILVLYGLLNFMLQLLLVGLIPIFHFPFIWIFYGMIIIMIAKWLILSLFLFDAIAKTFSWQIIQQILNNSWPLVLTAILTSSAVFIDGLIISIRFDESQFAVFRYGAKEFPLFLIMATSFSNSLLTRFSAKNEMSAVLNEIKYESRKMIKILFPVSILLLIISQYIYPLVFNSDFYESYKIFDVYLLLVVSRFVFPQTIFIGLQKNKFVLKAGFLELIINIISSIILIRYFGIIGVAFGTIIAFYAEKIILIYFVNKNLAIKPAEFIDTKMLFIFSIILWLVFIFKNVIV